MNPHRRRIDHLNLAIVGLGNGVHQLIPNARFAPAIEAVVAGRVRAVALGQVAPWRTRAQNPEDAIEHLPVTFRPDAPAIAWKKWLYHTPLEVREVVAHDSPPPDRELESHLGN